MHSQKGSPFFGMLLGFFMHMIPTFVLIFFLVFTWKKPKWASIAYLVMAVIFTVAFDTYEHIINFLILTVLLLIVSGLYFWDFKLQHFKLQQKN